MKQIGANLYAIHYLDENNELKVKPYYNYSTDYNHIISYIGLEFKIRQEKIVEIYRTITTRNGSTTDCVFKRKEHNPSRYPLRRILLKDKTLLPVTRDILYAGLTVFYYTTRIYKDNITEYIQLKEHLIESADIHKHSSFIKCLIDYNNCFYDPNEDEDRILRVYVPRTTSTMKSGIYNMSSKLAKIRSKKYPDNMRAIEDISKRYHEDYVVRKDKGFKTTLKELKSLCRINNNTLVFEGPAANGGSTFNYFHLMDKKEFDEVVNLLDQKVINNPHKLNYNLQQVVRIKVRNYDKTKKYSKRIKTSKYSIIKTIRGV